MAAIRRTYHHEVPRDRDGPKAAYTPTLKMRRQDSSEGVVL